MQCACVCAACMLVCVCTEEGKPCQFRPYSTVGVGGEEGDVTAACASCVTYGNRFATTSPLIFRCTFFLFASIGKNIPCPSINLTKVALEKAS